MRTRTPTARPSFTAPASTAATTIPPQPPATGRKLLEQICACPSLPSVPTVVAEVLQATARPDADLQQVSRTIAQDPALVARVLRAVNSSYYGLRHRVASVAQALPVLGLKNLRVLVAGHSVFPALKQCGSAGAQQLDCCRRSLYSATAARLLAERLGVGSPDECFLAALLMDIGVLAMATAIGHRYGDVLRGVERHADLERAEQEHLGLSHTVVAAVLTRQWKLPETLAVPIQFHHSPQFAAGGPHECTARIIRLAGVCADVFLEHNPLWPITEAHRLSGEDFGADKGEIDGVLEELAAETRRLGEAFDVQVDEAATFARAHGRATEELRAGIPDGDESPHAATTAEPAEHPGAPAGSDAAGDAPRRPHGGTVTVFPCNQTTLARSVRAVFRDVSPTGIELRFDEPLEVGSQFILGLRRGGGRRATVILYRVRHCQQQSSSEGGHTVDAALVRVLREHDLLSDAAADSPLHRLGRVLLGTPRAAARDAACASSHSSVPTPLAEEEPCGMNDPGAVCC
jgi:HD-like signal output (HDOD) protein